MTSQQQAPVARLSQENRVCHGMQERQQRVHEEFDIAAENKFVNIYWAFLKKYVPTVAEQAVIVKHYGVSTLEDLITQQYQREVINHWLGEHLTTQKIHGQGGFMQAKKRRMETWLNGKMCKFLAASPKVRNCKESRVCVCVVRAQEDGSSISTFTKIDKQLYDRLVYTYEFLPSEQEYLEMTSSAMFGEYERQRRNESAINSNTQMQAFLVVKRNLLEVLDICYVQKMPIRAALAMGTVAAGWDEVRNLFLIEQTKVEGEIFEQIFYSQLLTEISDDLRTCKLQVRNLLERRQESLLKQEMKALAVARHEQAENMYR